MTARLLLFVGQALDTATFALFFAVVPAVILAELGKSERNPVILALFAIGGPAAVAIVKVGATGLVIWRDHQRPNRPRKTAVFMIVAGASGFVGAAFNLMALAAVLGALGL